MRIEKITAKALENVNFDRYLLASAVGKRAEELAAGAQPLVELDPKKSKYADIALLEIAEGKIIVNLEN
jgi:DNA-directed RNA polymerase subunit omega